MLQLGDALAYLCARYPQQGGLSVERITYMAYLADWRCALTTHKQLTEVQWEFGRLGPDSVDVLRTLREDGRFVIVPNRDMSPESPDAVELGVDASAPVLDTEDMAVLDFVIDRVSTKDWTTLTRLVYSTFPILTKGRFSKLDLVQLANLYKAALNSRKRKLAS
jgi:hypothetical protein